MIQCDITLMVEDEGKEREVIITEYSFVEGLPAITNRAPEDCSPGEPDRLEDIEMHWFDTGNPLTDDEFDLHQDEIEAAIMVNREEDRG